MDMLEQRVAELEKGQKSIMERQASHEKTQQEQYRSILHDVNQARQESKNTTIYVKEVDDKLDKLMHYIMPDEAIGSIGIFKKQIELEKRVADIETERKVEKGQLTTIKAVIAFLGTIMGFAIAYFKSKL
jgi:hypothetical protein